MPSRPILNTWADLSQFQYEGSVPKDITIYCGKDFSHRYGLSAAQLREILTVFSGREVKLGTHRTAPPDGSIEDWIRKHFKRGGIMSYLGVILIHYCPAITRIDSIG
jgi:hypothetical protein